MSCTYSQQIIQAVIAFHGHFCPGLAIGIRAAEYLQTQFPQADPEELVTVSETDMCGVDALQFLTGCTLGKGNLILRPYGKMAFTFFHRPSGRGVRALLRPQARGEPQADQGAGDQRQVLRERFMGLPLDGMFAPQQPREDLPGPARIEPSLTCERCGEETMQGRTRQLQGQTLCLPCYWQLRPGR
jgi:formylmethanofuran dehydrogenase subunit E